MRHLAVPANFGSLSREYPHSPSVNECFLSIFDPRVAGSLVISPSSTIDWYTKRSLGKLGKINLWINILLWKQECLLQWDFWGASCDNFFKSHPRLLKNQIKSYCCTWECYFHLWTIFSIVPSLLRSK